MLKRIHLLPFLCLPLVNCGGGGGGGSSTPQSYTITTDTASVSATLFDHQWACTGHPLSSVNVTGRISPMPPSRIYPVVTLSSSGFNPVGATVYTNPDGTFTANFMPDWLLPEGTYTGSMSLSLYADSAHTVPLGVAGGGLTYTVEVKPQLSVTAGKIDGTLSFGNIANTQNPGGNISIPNGSILELDTNIPVTWSYSSGPGLVGVAPQAGSTATAWQGRLTLAASPSTSSVQLIGLSQDGLSQSVTVSVSLY